MDMPSQCSNPFRAQRELSAELFRIVRLQVEKRSLQQRKARHFLRREAGELLHRLRLGKGVDVRQQFRDSSALGDLCLKMGEFVGGKGALLLLKLRANRLAGRNQLVEEVESEWSEGDVGLLRQVDSRTPSIEYAHARDELIVSTPCPFPRPGLGANPVLDRHNRCMRGGPGNNVAEDLFLSTGPARALENSDIPGLSRSVVPIDDGKTRREAEGLVLRESVHPPLMEYGIKRNRGVRSCLVRNMLPRKRNDVLRLGEAKPGLAYLRELLDVFIR